MSDIKWLDSIAAVSLMTTELNSLANAAAAITAAAVDQNTPLATHGDFELVVTYGTNPTADSAVELWIARTIDGTNFEDCSTTGPIVPANGFVGGFILRATTAAQRLVVPKVELPPLDFHVLVVNKSGQAMAASGNTLKVKMYRKQVV